MMVLPTKEDYSELIRTLEQAAVAVDEGASSPPAESMDEVLKALQTFRTTVAMMELQGAAEECSRIEKQARACQSGKPVDGVEPSGLGSSIDSLKDRLTLAMNGDEAAIARLRNPETAVPAPNGGQPENACCPSVSGLDYTKLKEAVEKLGGTLALTEPAGGDPKFQVVFPATPLSMDMAEGIFSKLEQDALLQQGLTAQNPRMEKVLTCLRDFMVALSKGELASAQGTLEMLAEQQQQAGLYREIGGIARSLHNSINDFLESLDPTLKRLVASDIPDSGSRLGRVLEILENSATTTIDSVELLQTRNLLNEERLTRALNIMDKLAKKQEGDVSSMNETRVLLSETIMSMQQGHDNLMTVLTSQAYQDLASQIMEKVTLLLGDMEIKLVDLIKRFSIKSEKDAACEGAPPKKKKVKDTSLASQTEIDSLLADFGF